MGLAKEPGLFRCGIDLSGWTDMDRLFHADRVQFLGPMGHEWGTRQLVGDRETMADQLERTSPLNQVGRIKAPVLMVYGKNSQLPPIQDGAAMRNALERHHVPVEWMAFDVPFGGDLNDDDGYRYYDAVEQFLRKYNPPD